MEEYFASLPLTIKGLKDDPYRSLAGALRRSGAYAKDWTPFSEFRWANYLRERMLLTGDDDRDLLSAKALTRRPSAIYLPGVDAVEPNAHKEDG